MDFSVDCDWKSTNASSVNASHSSSSDTQNRSPQFSGWAVIFVYEKEGDGIAPYWRVRDILPGQLLVPPLHVKDMLLGVLSHVAP